jgi:hypothetical protein
MATPSKEKKNLCTIQKSQASIENYWIAFSKKVEKKLT